MKDGVQNDYKDAIDDLIIGYWHLSNFMMGFGIGAKTIPKRGDASDCFSLTGDIFNPIFYPDDLYKMYSDSMWRVELSLPVNFHKVLQVAAEYAKYEKEQYECWNYFVLIIVSVGVIDDFQDTLKVLKEMGDLPLSI